MGGSRIALGIRRLRRRSRRKERLRSLLLSTAARDFRRSPRASALFPVLAGVELASSIFLSRLALNPLFSLGG
jgi:hypothetical protein